MNTKHYNNLIANKRVKLQENTYNHNTINITQVTPPNDKLSFKIANSNQKIEKIAFKAVENIYGHNVAIEYSEKFHRAPVSNDALITDLLRNNSTGVPRCKDPSYLKSLDHIKKLCKPSKPLKHIHFSGTRMYDLNKSGSAELPYVTDPKVKRAVRQRYQAGEIANESLSKGNCMNIILEKERIRVHQIKDQLLPKEKLTYDTRMHARSHLTSISLTKIRAVYGVFCTLIFVEIMLLWPLFCVTQISRFDDCMGI